MFRFLFGISKFGFYFGVVMLCLGLGFLALGWIAPYEGYALVLYGIIRMAFGYPAMVGMVGGDSALRRRNLGPRLAQPYVAPPNEMPLGRCWMCGGKVKRGNVICLHCGAAQPPTAPGESETSRLSGYDPNAGDLVTFLPSDGPESSSPYPSAPYPAVNPGGYPTPGRASPWNARKPPPAPAPGSVWRPEPDSDGDWDEAPAKRQRWRLR
jgi:hypothetical protein